MTTQDRLFCEFSGALNAELTALGCRLHVADASPGPDRTMLLLAADGSELGWVPDHSDAPVIAAFERILVRCDRVATGARSGLRR